MLQRFVLVLAASLALSACGEDRTPVSPTPLSAAPPPPAIVVSLPTNFPGVLSVLMPIDAADVANTAFGLAPYGYHGADHAEDGHPGWDIEYRLGGTVRAAAAGTVQSVIPDPLVPGRSTVQIAHEIPYSTGTHFYRTVYTNLSSVSAAVAVDAVVVAGQPLGVAGTVSLTIGTVPITYAMTHFQLDDFEYYREIPNPNAVSPEPFLTPSGRAVFDRIWTIAAFGHELVEPLASNPRALRFPASRTWTRVAGDGPAAITFTRRTARAADYEYALLAESGTIVETGTVTLAVTSRPFPGIDLTSPTAQRLGMYDIISNEMRLVLAPPGSSRPVALSSASLYQTAAP